MNFAFYGRVSTEDQQDPQSSHSWQFSRSMSLIEPAGGHIVAEYFDIGQSRSLPWKRRPEAARLLGDLSKQGRGFEAVVIGEPARAFYGNQFGLTFPVFVHYGVELWVPEVGGRVDPGSEAHDLVMSLYGGMSKGERNRIRMRVRTAMAAQARTEGRFLGGRPPYGYQLVDAGPHPNPGKASVGQRLQRLEPDPITAPIVQRIFSAFLAGQGIYAIAEALTRDGIPSPSGHDPERNRHRASSNGAWGKSAVRAILMNPRYTGRQVWNKQRRDEVLLDVEDVSLGHETKQRWNDRAEWIVSDGVVHRPLIDDATFQAAEDRRTSRAGSASKRRTKKSAGYALSGVLFCDLCGRRMSGSLNHGHTYYRCRFPSEYALTADIDHPKTVYLQERTFLPQVDHWLAQLFDPENLDETCSLLAQAGDGDQTGARKQAALKKVADCEHKLTQYRQALEQGADPAVVAEWIREITAAKGVAERDLLEVKAQTPSEDEIRALVAQLGEMATALRDAQPELKSELYAALGLRLSYNPVQAEVQVELTPACTYGRVGGGT